MNTKLDAKLIDNNNIVLRSIPLKFFRYNQLYIYIHIVWFHFVFSNLQDQISINRGKINQIARNKILLEDSKKSNIMLTKQIDELKKDLEKYSAKKNKNETSISIPIDLANKSGLRLASCSTGDKEKYKELLNKQSISYEFSGNKEQIFSFCNSLKNSDNVTSCEEITISETDEKNCNLKCILQFFYTR